MRVGEFRIVYLPRRRPPSFFLVLRNVRYTTEYGLHVLRGVTLRTVPVSVWCRSWCVTRSPNKFFFFFFDRDRFVDTTFDVDSGCGDTCRVRRSLEDVDTA